MTREVLESWLQVEARDPFEGDFRLLDVGEVAPPSDETAEYLARAVLEDRFDPAFLKSLVEGLGWDRAAEAVERTGIPGVASARRGQFGETLGLQLLEHLDAYSVPVRKLRVAITADQSLPRADGVVVRVDPELGSIAEVCLVEVKTRTTPDTSAGVSGADQLRSYLTEKLPDVFIFVLSRLFESNNPLYEPLMAYCRERTADKRESARLILVFDADAWRSRVVDNMVDAEIALEELTVHAIRLDQLRPFVERVFGRAGLEVIEDES